MSTMSRGVSGFASTTDNSEEYYLMTDCLSGEIKWSDTRYSSSDNHWSSSHPEVDNSMVYLLDHKHNKHF